MFVCHIQSSRQLNRIELFISSATITELNRKEAINIKLHVLE